MRNIDRPITTSPTRSVSGTASTSVCLAVSCSNLPQLMNKIQRNLSFLTWGRKSFLSRSVRNHDFPAEKQRLKVEVLIIIPTVLHLAAKPPQLELEITSDWTSSTIICKKQQKMWSRSSWLHIGVLSINVTNRNSEHKPSLIVRKAEAGGWWWWWWWYLFSFSHRIWVTKTWREISILSHKLSGQVSYVM